MEVIRYTNESGYRRFQCPVSGCEATSSRGPSIVDHARAAHGVELSGFKPRPRQPGSLAPRAAPPEITDIGDVPETVLVVVHGRDGRQQGFRSFGASFERVRDAVVAALQDHFGGGRES